MSGQCIKYARNRNFLSDLPASHPVTSGYGQGSHGRMLPEPVPAYMDMPGETCGSYEHLFNDSPEGITCIIMTVSFNIFHA